MGRVRRAEVIGLPVLTDAGERLGDVEDVLVDRGGRRVIGFLLAGGNRLLGHRVYPIEEVRAVGDGAVVVARRDTVLHTRQVNRLRRLLARHADLVGKRLVSRAGQDLGVISDLVFDPETGAVLGFDLSGGFFRDVTEGRGFVPASVRLVVGKDAVIAPPPGEEAGEAEGRGGGGAPGGSPRR